VQIFSQQELRFKEVPSARMFFLNLTSAFYTSHHPLQIKNWSTGEATAVLPPLKPVAAKIASAVLSSHFRRQKG
jgi:hypothetical protein